MAEEETVPLGRRFRYFLRVHRAFFSVLLLAIGIFLTILAAGDFTPLSNYWPFTEINKITDKSSSGGVNYNLIFVVVGPIVTIIGAYFVGAYYVARRKFEHLMKTKSKAEFLRNIPEIEDLLWELTPNDEVRYEHKKAELKVRR